MMKSRCLVVLLLLAALALDQTLAVELNKAELDKLYPNTPNPQADVLELNLANKNYDTIAAATFAAFTKVVTINLDRNNLAAQSFTLLNLAPLKNLIVSRNNIKTVSFDAADANKLKTLTSIDLSANLIETLATSYPDYAPEMATLNLQNNLIASLKADQFTSAKLLSIDLSGNRIATIDAGAFKTAELTTLKLAANQLTAFANTAFSGASKVSMLDLSSNKIASFPTEAVNALANLKELDLGQNQISELTGNFLGTNNVLRSLKLAGNRISKVNLDAINDANRCFTFLEFSGNPIANGLTVAAAGNSTSPCKKLTCKGSSAQTGDCSYTSSPGGRLATGSLWLLVTLLGSYIIKH